MSTDTIRFSDFGHVCSWSMRPHLTVAKHVFACSVALALVISTGCRSSDGDLDNQPANQLTDHERIRGEWQEVYLNDADRRFITAEEYEELDIRWFVGEQKIDVRYGDGRTEEMTYSLDETKQPKRIVLDGAPGIYAFKDDRLKICYNESYRPDPADRPTDFDPDPPNEVFQMLKRIEPAAEPVTDSATEPAGEVGDP
jgi:uncharacterized protein (TIGR03067 family)